MKIGVFLPLVSRYTTPALIVQAAQAAEAAGFHSVWAPEHVLLFDEYASRYPYSADGRLRAGAGDTGGVLEPLNLLAFVAAATSRIRLGTGICLVPQRNPVYTAKEVATVDYLSGGRVDFGVGIGWLSEEFAALGVPFERRAQRTRAYLDVMKRLWCDPVSSYDGEFYKLPASRQYPKPVQQPHPPIHFGGESDAALRRVADIGQGWYGFMLEPDGAAERVRYLHGLLEKRGRAPEEVFVSVSPSVGGLDGETLAAYLRAGVDQLIIPGRGRSAEEFLETLNRLGKEVVEPAAAL
jgi:probable F420-dependent oxidoreductase